MAIVAVCCCSSLRHITLLLPIDHNPVTGSHGCFFDDLFLGWLAVVCSVLVSMFSEWWVFVR